MLLAYWIGCTVLPVSLVDGTQFKNCVRKLNPEVRVFFASTPISY